MNVRPPPCMPWVCPPGSVYIFCPFFFAQVCTWKCLLPGRIVIFFKLDRMEAMLRCCYSGWWVALQLLFLLVGVVGDARPQIRLRPNCSTSCGGVSVPCPFGIDPDCYLLGFKLNCSTSWTPPRLFVGHGQVLYISLGDSTIHFVVRGVYYEAAAARPLLPNATGQPGLHLFPALTELVVEWEIGSGSALLGPNETRAGNATCPSDLGTTACHSSYSICQATTRSKPGGDKVTGYVCKCHEGYRGNAYLSDRCQGKQITHHVMSCRLCNYICMCVSTRTHTQYITANNSALIQSIVF